jgi:hypothetical protein
MLKAQCPVLPVEGYGIFFLSGGKIRILWQTLTKFSGLFCFKGNRYFFVGKYLVH